MKKRLLCILLVLICIVTTLMPFQTVDAKRTWVKSYTRKDGTRVSGYYRNSGSTSGSDNTSTSTNSKPVINVVPVTNKNNGVIFYNKCVNLYKNYDLIGKGTVDKLVYVKGYYDRYGNYIRPHYRTYPNQYKTDNFSYSGISTLKPLSVSKKYKYTFSTNEDIKTIETYVLHNIENKVNILDSDQADLIKVYAESLHNNTATFEFGKNVYKALEYGDIDSSFLSKFDINGLLTSDLYLYSVLSNNSIVIKDDLRWLFNYYVALLNLYSTKVVSYNKVKNFANQFYKIIGLPTSYIDEQVEMDLLQNLSYSNDYSYYEEVLKNLVYVDLTYDWDDNKYNSFFESYMAAINNIEKYSMLDTYLSLYDMSLEFLKNQINSNTLMSTYYWGGKFYELLGTSDEIVNQRIQQDITLYLLY